MKVWHIGITYVPSYLLGIHQKIMPMKVQSHKRVFMIYISDALVRYE